MPILKKLRRVFISAFCCLLVLLSRSEGQLSSWSHLPLEASIESWNADDSARGNSAPTKTSLLQDNIRYGRLAIVGGALGATIAGIHIYQMNGWWKENRTSFHFREDLNYSRNIDKIGHVYAGSVLTFVFSKALEWGNVPESKALLLGAGASLLFQTYVELEDGFSAWGFDRVDFASDVVGAWYPVVQHHIPYLKNFNLKLSYLPSQNINKPGGYPGQKHLVMDDYEGQVFWLSLNVHNLLPRDFARVWPEFLPLAIGIKGRDIENSNAHLEFYVALDYDMTKILPDTGFLRTVGEALNFIHFPSPAVRISPGVVFYGLYFSR